MAGYRRCLEHLLDRFQLKIVALPIAEDQPGVAVRIQRAGIGVAIPASAATTETLREAVNTVLTDRKYRVCAESLRIEVAGLDGPGMATEIIERVLNI